MFADRMEQDDMVEIQISFHFDGNVCLAKEKAKALIDDRSSSKQVANDDEIEQNDYVLL